VPDRDTIVDHLWGSCDQIDSSPVNIAGKSNPSEAYMLYPNPAKNRFFIRLSFPLKNTSVRIYELTGKEVHSSISYTNSELTVDVKNLKDGLYIVGIQQNGEFSFRKLLIKRV